MRKLFWISFILTLALMGSFPFALSWLELKFYVSQVEKNVAAKSWAQDVKLLVLENKPGFSQGHVKYKLNFILLSETHPGPIELTVTHRIDTFPEGIEDFLVFKDLRELRFHSVFAIEGKVEPLKKYTSLMSVAPHLSGEIYANLGKNILINVKLNDFKMEIPELLSLEQAGAHLELELDYDSKKPWEDPFTFASHHSFEIRAKIAKLAGKKEGTPFDLQNARTFFRLYLFRDYYRRGELKLTLPEVTWAGLRHNGSNHFTFGNIGRKDEDQLWLDFKKLKKEEASSKLFTWIQSGLTVTTAAEVPATTAAAGTPAPMKSDIKIKNRLRLYAPQGELELKVKLSKLKNEQQFKAELAAQSDEKFAAFGVKKWAHNYFMKNPRPVSAADSAGAGVTPAVTEIKDEQVGRLVQLLAGQEWLKQEGSHYKINLTYVGKNVEINGKPYVENDLRPFLSVLDGIKNNAADPFSTEAPREVSTPARIPSSVSKP